MSDWLLPDQGARPWLPAPGTTEHLVLSEYGIPLAGLIEQHGSSACRHAFLAKPRPQRGAYARVSEGQAERISALRGQAVTAAVAETVTYLPATVALAHDHELQYWLHMTSHGDSSPLALAARFPEQLRPILESIRRHADERARLGDVTRAS